MQHNMAVPEKSTMETIKRRNDKNISSFYRYIVHSLKFFGVGHGHGVLHNPPHSEVCEYKWFI